MSARTALNVFILSCLVALCCGLLAWFFGWLAHALAPLH